MRGRPWARRCGGCGNFLDVGDDTLCAARVPQWAMRGPHSVCADDECEACEAWEDVRGDGGAVEDKNIGGEEK